MTTECNKDINHLHSILTLAPILRNVRQNIIRRQRSQTNERVKKKWTTTINQVYWNLFTFIPSIPDSKQFLFIFVFGASWERRERIENWNDACINSSAFSILHKNRAARQEGEWNVHIFTTFKSIVHAAHPISPNSLCQKERKKTRLKNKQTKWKPQPLLSLWCYALGVIVLFFVAHWTSITRRIIVKCLVVLRPVFVCVCVSLCLCWCG